MKKKILCLALCIVMVFASLVACDEPIKEEIMNNMGKKASDAKGAITVTMHLLSEKPVSPEQEAIVEAAVNEYMDDYGIYLDIKYFTEAPVIENGVQVKPGYYTALENSLDTMLKKAAEDKANKKNQNKVTTDATGETTDATVAETQATQTDAQGNVEYLYIDENGLPKIYYPPNPDYHVDIFYFSGYDRYVKYRDAGYLANFKNPLENDTCAKLMKNGVSTVLFDAVKKLNNSKYDMMPCNTQVGEYTYLLLNKDVLDSAQYTVEQVGSLTSANLTSFLDFVKVYYPEYATLYSTETALPAPLNGYSAVADTQGKPFAVGYIKGDVSISEEYEEDYEIVVLEKPTIQSEGVYEHVFAISSYTKQLVKSARALSEIYTNENVINILAHGVEGTNYVWTNSDKYDADNNYEYYRVINKITDDAKYVYAMDPNKIGNTALTYPTVNDNPRRTQNILKQNSEATLITK